MKYSKKGVCCLRQTVVTLCCCLALVACGSGSDSDTSPSLGIDDPQLPGEGAETPDGPQIPGENGGTPDNPQIPDENGGTPDSDLPITIVEPILQGALAELRFDLLEDSQLRGEFFQAENPPAGPVTLRSLPLHGRLVLESDGAVFLYTADENYWGEDSFQYITFDGLEVSVQLDIEAVNDAPRLSPELARVAEQGRLFVETLEASDGDGDTLRFNAIGLPDWLTLNAASGILSGTPTQLDIGFADDITLRVTDSTGLFDEVTGVRIEVIDVNDTPTLNLSQVPSEMRARESVSVRVFPDDADGDSVSLSVERNAFVTGSAEGGTITLVAEDVNDVTEVNVVIVATDRLGGVSREVITLTLLPLTESGNGVTLAGSAVGRGVHLVVLGDGYAVDQQLLFREHVDNVIANMAADDGIAAHLGAFNIHKIATVSVDSGSDDNEQTDSRDTAFDSTYNCRSVARLICANTLAMFEAALVEYPAVDQIILLVNDRRFGGSGNSGGSVAITSAYAPEIALHEMGHSLADLADEYVDPQIVESQGLVPFEEGRYANVTAFTDPQDVPWRLWFDDADTIPTRDGQPGVGLFEGGLYRDTGVFRPTFDSRMRSFDAPFGPVNSERWILRLYRLTEGIRGFSPILETVELVAGENQEFLVSPLFGDDIQSVTWEFNGVEISSGQDPSKLVLAPPVGTHELIMTVTDISGAIREEPPHAGIFTWTWEIVVE